MKQICLVLAVVGVVLVVQPSRMAQAQDATRPLTGILAKASNNENNNDYKYKFKHDGNPPIYVAKFEIDPSLQSWRLEREIQQEWKSFLSSFVPDLKNLNDFEFNQYFAPHVNSSYGNGTFNCFVVSELRPGAWWDKEPNVSPVDWQPSMASSRIPQGPLKNIFISFADGEQAGGGYYSADMQFRYRFLLCADEIQVAYTIDPKSLKLNPIYVGGVTSTGERVNADASASPPPPLPPSIPVNLTIWARTYPETIVGRLIDKNVTEALGMGCFSGQTRKVGLVSKLLGPSPTKDKVQKYLESLDLAAATGQGINLDFPLLNPAVPLPPGVAPKRSERPAPRAAAAPAPDAEVGAARPPVVDDTPGVTAANKAGAAAAKAQLDKIIADKEAYRVSVEKTKADYDAKMALYRRQVAEQNAQNEAAKRAYEAKMTLYRACVAGDKGACQQYKAQ